MTEAVLIRELRLRPHKQPAAAGSGPDFTQRASQSPRFLSGAAWRESETASARGSASGSASAAAGLCHCVSPSVTRF